MEFVCRLGTPEGRVVEEVHRAEDRVSLVGELERKGYHVFELRTRGLPFSLRLPRWRRRRVKKQDFLVYNQELAALLRAGLPLLQALDLMLERRSNPAFKSLLSEVRERVKAGEDMSQAFAHFGDLFPPLYSATLKAGERSGELEQVIRRFIRYLRLTLEARRKAISAVVYPTVLLVLSGVMLAVMGLYVIPRFEDFYVALEVELPWLTRAILGASVFVRRHALVLALLALVTGGALVQWSRRPSGRLLIDRWKLRIPYVGAIAHRFSLSEFSRSLSTLLAGGIPLVPSLEVSVGAIGNRFIRSRLAPTVSDVKEGRAFHESLDDSGVVTDIAIDMIQVGESTGALDQMLAEVADFLDQEVETRLERFLALLEPIMLVVMGSLIAILLIAMYLPMFSAWQEIR